MKAIIQSAWAEARVWVELVLAGTCIVLGGFLLWVAGSMYFHLIFLLNGK